MTARKPAKRQPQKEEVSALARGIAVVQAVADATAAPNNRDLATTTGLPKATVSRLTATLVAAGYLRVDKNTDRYSLGSTLLRLSHAALRDFQLRDVARPYLTELAESMEANVHLTVSDGISMMVIDSVSPRAALILVQLAVGARMDMTTSAVGRAYLESLQPLERAAVFEKLSAEMGVKWNAMLPGLQALLTDCSAKGYTTSFGEWHPDINAIAVAIQDPTGMRFAINCGGPAYVFTAERLTNHIAPALLRTAKRISERAGS